MASESPVAPVDPKQERVDLVDANDRIIGWARRQKIRKLNLLHRGVGIICYNPAKEIYVHRRTTTKDVFPGMYDMFVGGVVRRGESYETTAVREIAEELGIDGPTPRHLFDHLYLGPRNRAIVSVFEVEWDGPIRHQPEEVEWGTWMTRKELDAKIDEWEFVPDGLEIWFELVERT